MSSQVPQKMKAITVNGNTAKVSEIPVPKLRPTYILAKVDAVALNPTVRAIHHTFIRALKQLASWINADGRS